MSIISAKNGSGKSSMFDAIVFALFGRPYRKINKPNLVNSINGRGLVTEVEFSVNDQSGKNVYRVVRGIKPNVFEIYQNGNKLDEADNARDQQKFLEDSILKTNYRAFIQIVILGSGTYIPFMHLTSSQRREFIENLLDIDIFSSMNSLLKGRYSILRELKTITDSKIQSTKDKMGMQKSLIERLKNQRSQEQQSLQNEIDDLKERIESEQAKKIELESQMSVIEKKLQNMDDRKLQSTKESVLSDISDLDSHIKRVHKDKSFMEEHTTCPTCKQDIDESYRKSFIDTSLSNLKESKQERDQKDAWYQELKVKIAEIEKLNKEYFELKTKVQACESSIQKYQTDVEAKKSRESLVNSEDIQKEKSTLQSLESQLKQHSENRQFLNHKNELYDAASDLLKDNGIKSRIISQYIPIMNKLINQYLSELNFHVSFTLDETFTERILSRYRDDFTYDNFSNGEKMRIDISLLMVWRNLAEMKNSIHTNILLMDEVFDSSLDEDGIDDFLKILSSVTKNNNIFIISHKVNQLESKFDRKIIVEKHNDFSYLTFEEL